jgi:hypothetical protein
MYTQLVLLSIGFSIGAALLLVIAFATAYRGIALPWQSRVGGYAMLLGLAVTQFFHARFLIDVDATLATRSYVLIVFLQSIGFYWLFLGLLRPPEQRWRIWEWLVLPLALACGAFLPVDVALPVAMVGGTAAAALVSAGVSRARAVRRDGGFDWGGKSRSARVGMAAFRHDLRVAD